jgi:acyl-CoA synthetase (AMP-forming)/AMP-acid ligase II
MSPNRLVALITPLAAPLAGWIATQAATQLPGLDLPKSALEEVFIAGALIALAPAAQWLHGWQKWETQQAQTEAAVQVATVGAEAEPPTIQVDVNQDAGSDEDEGFEVEDDFGLDEFDEFDDFDDDLLGDEEAVPAGV